MGLPSDLHREILLRLPASSLLRFRAVCKSWCHEIDDPFFVRAHTVNNQRTATFNSNSNLLLTSSSGAIYSIPVDSLNYDDWLGTLSATRVPCALPGLNHLLAADSCNGLVLLIRQKEWAIWNPLTGDYLELPPTCLADSPFLGCGIGYDPASDDYKVVSIREEKEFVYRAHIYSLRSNSWKRIEEKCPSCMITCRATLLNGVLHWLAEEAVVALDLATEKFRKLPFSYNGKSYSLHSEVLGGCLVVVRDDDLCGAWVLKDYEALNPEWVRLFTPMGLSLIKEDTRLVIHHGGVIKLGDVQSNSEKVINIEDQVEFDRYSATLTVGERFCRFVRWRNRSEETFCRFGRRRNMSEADYQVEFDHYPAILIVGESLFRFGRRRNSSKADDERLEKIQVPFFNVPLGWKSID